MDVWTFREATVGDIDLTGFTVEATDGKIGKVDEATYDIGRSFVVIDTGPWIFGKRVMLPAGTIERIDVENERVLVDRTKDEIKDAPEFDVRGDFDPMLYEPLGTYYGGFYAGTYSTTRQRDEL
jgi:hypothetical protein